MGRAPTPKKSVTRTRAKSKAVTEHTATGPLGVVREALRTGSYGTYVNGLLACGASYAEHGFATPDEFAAAADAFRHIELALISVGPMPRHLHEPLTKMGALARHVDDYNDAIAAVASWCGPLLGANANILRGSCANIARLLGRVRPELARLDPERMERLVLAEQAKRQPGANSLAAAFWNEAGLSGQRSKKGAPATIDNKAVAASVSRSNVRRRHQNER